MAAVAAKVAIPERLLAAAAVLAWAALVAQERRERAGPPARMVALLGESVQRQKQTLAILILAVAPAVKEAR